MESPKLSNVVPDEGINPSSTTYKKKSRWPYLVCFGIAIPQLFTQIYSSYFKLDGFNDSIKDLNTFKKIKFPTMSEWLIGILVAIYVFTFIAYTIFGVFEKFPATISKSHKDPKKIVDEENKACSKKDAIASFLTGKKYNDLSKMQITMYGFIYVFALTNTALYSYTSFHASNQTFLKQNWCKTQKAALVLAIICTIGAILKDFSYVIPNTVKAFPQIFNLRKLKRLYWDLVKDENSKYSIRLRRLYRITLGILLIILALASIPLSLNIASYSKLPSWLAFSGSIITMIIIYTCSAGSLCSDEIDRENGTLDPNKKNKADENKNSSRLRKAGFYFCGGLFYISCLIPAAGMGFSWEKMLKKKWSFLSFGVIFGVFLTMTFLAVIGRVFFCKREKTINAMTDSPQKLKHGFEIIFLNKNHVQAEGESETDSNKINQSPSNK